MIDMIRRYGDVCCSISTAALAENFPTYVDWVSSLNYERKQLQ